MKRNSTVLFLLMLSMCAGSLYAQKAITFDSVSHKVSATVGGAYVIQLDDYTPPLGGNMEWDIASALKIPINAGYSVLSYQKNTNEKYGNSLIADSTFVNITSSLGFYTQAYSRQTAAQFEEFTLDKPVQESFPLAALSGGSNDVLTIPAQTIAYSTPRIMIAYPATSGSAWKSNYRYVANTQLSVAAYALNKAPLALVKNVTIEDSVVGWGKATVPMIGAKKSKVYDVLMVRRAFVRQDSFYLGGQPAPAPLMAAFGVSQGSTETNYRYIAFRLDSPNYLFLLYYGTDASMSIAPRMGISDIVEAASTTSAEVASNTIASAVTPNPASNEITLSFHKPNDAAWSLEIYSVFGGKVESRMISAGYGTTEIPISVAHLASGNYNYVLRDENNQVVVSKGFVVVH